MPVASRSCCSICARYSLPFLEMSRNSSSSALYPSRIMPPSRTVMGALSLMARDKQRADILQRVERRFAAFYQRGVAGGGVFLIIGTTCSVVRSARQSRALSAS